MVSLEQAFAVLTPDEITARKAREHLRQQMHLPAPRAYHNETHIVAVLGCVFGWSDFLPPVALVAAALYHDAVYDPTRSDNETQSGVFCQSELRRLKTVDQADISEAVRLIELTASHQIAKEVSDTAADVLLCDADLFILGDTPEKYAAYVQAVREEYAHVSDVQWREGRPAVMRRFLQRDKIYRGNWAGRDAREKQARENVAREIAALTA